MRSERPEPPKLAIPSYRVMFEYTQCENTAKHNYRLFYVGKTLQLLGYINVDKDVRQVARASGRLRSEEHTSELQSHSDLVCRLLLEKKKKQQ